MPPKGSNTLKHCVVIGGSGFIGSYLTNLLAASGRKVTVIGRSSTPAKPLPDGVTYLPGDYGDKVFLARTIQGADEIIDLAYSTVPKTSFDDPTYDLLTNLPMSVGLFEAAAAAGVSRLVFISSGGTVYGKNSHCPLAENSLTNPVSPYGITKLAIEKYAYMYNELKNLPVICVRPGNAFGEGQYPFRGQGFIATAMASIIKGQEIVVFGEQGTVRDYLYVKDVAQGIMAALEMGTPGICYNVGSGIGRTNIDIINDIRPLADKAGMEVRIRKMPFRAFDVPINILDSGLLHAETAWSPSNKFEAALKGTWNWLVSVADKY